MLKNFKIRFILAIIGLGIFIGIVVYFFIINNSKTNNELYNDNIMEENSKSINLERKEENNHVVEKTEDTKEITSKEEEKDDLSIYPKENTYDTQTNSSEQKLTINQNTNTENKSNKKEEPASTQKAEESRSDNVLPQVKDEPKEEQKTTQTEIDDNSVDTSSLDYNEHKGRINCYSSDECMSISIPIQLKFKKSITHSSFIDVMSKSGNTLGYFIEYHFKENEYSSNEECERIGSEIKQTLSKIIIGYQCSGSTLKVYTDY